MFEKAVIDGGCEREAPPATSVRFGEKLWLSEVGRAGLQLALTIILG